MELVWRRAIPLPAGELCARSNSAARPYYRFAGFKRGSWSSFCRFSCPSGSPLPDAGVQGAEWDPYWLDCMLVGLCH